MRPPAAAARALRSEAPRVSAARSRLASALPLAPGPGGAPGPRGAAPCSPGVGRSAAKFAGPVQPGVCERTHGRGASSATAGRGCGLSPGACEGPGEESAARHRSERAARKWERSAQHGGGAGPHFHGDFSPCLLLAHATLCLCHEPASERSRAASRGHGRSRGLHMPHAGLLLVCSAHRQMLMSAGGNGTEGAQPLPGPTRIGVPWAPRQPAGQAAPPRVSGVAAGSTAGRAGDLWLACLGPFAGVWSIQALGQYRAWCQVGRGFLTQGHKSPSIAATVSKITSSLVEVDRSWLAVDEFSPQTRCVAPSQVPPLEGAEKPLSRSSAGSFPKAQAACSQEAPHILSPALQVLHNFG